jgi:Carboxypeptidase regulatory-like domain
VTGRAATFTVLAFLSGAAMSGCAAKPVALARCVRDEQCGEGFACGGGTCLPREAPPSVWGIEIAPPSDSPAAFTELTQVNAPAATFDVQAGAKTTITVALPGDATTTTLSTAHLVLSVPSALAGRPDLHFETDLPPAKDAGPATFTLQIPKALSGRYATFQVLPLTPSDQTNAPQRASVMIGDTVTLPVPAAPLSVHGRLLSAVGDPRSGFTARAYRGADLISNVAVTMKDGTFTLLVPTLSGDDSPITVDLEPATGAADPRFTSRSMPLVTNTDLGDVTLPPFGQPNVFRFVVQGTSVDAVTIPGAVVRAWTLLADDAPGKTDFVRAAPTDVTGSVSMGLLPGTTVALRNYDVAVVPPPESLYGLRCIPQFPLASGGTAMLPANVPPIVLPRRTSVSGIVRGHDGTPAEGVMILATRTAADPASLCASNVGATPATTTTDGDGAYTLRLDPGTYRLDVDPASGAPFPRLTEAGVVVSAATTLDHPITLPAGAVVEGTARGPDGAPLPLTAVRFYELACPSSAACTGAAGVEPTLRAQTRADATGHFRVVIPTNAPTSTP